MDSETLSNLLRRSDSRYEDLSYGKRCVGMYHYIARKLKKKGLGRLLRIRTTMVGNQIYRLFVIGPSEEISYSSYSRDKRCLWFVRDRDSWVPLETPIGKKVPPGTVVNPPWSASSIFSNPYFVHHYSTPSIVSRPLYYFHDAQLLAISKEYVKAVKSIKDTCANFMTLPRSSRFETWSEPSLIKLAESFILAVGVAFAGESEDVRISLAPYIPFMQRLEGAFHQRILFIPSAQFCCYMLRHMIDPNNLHASDSMWKCSEVHEMDAETYFYQLLAHSTVPVKFPYFDRRRMETFSNRWTQTTSPWGLMTLALCESFCLPFCFSFGQYSSSIGRYAYGCSSLNDNATRIGSIVVEYDSEYPLQILYGGEKHFTSTRHSIYLPSAGRPAATMSWKTKQVTIVVYQGYPIVKVSPIPDWRLFVLDRFGVYLDVIQGNHFNAIGKRHTPVPARVKCLTCQTNVVYETLGYEKFSRHGMQLKPESITISDRSIHETRFTTSEKTYVPHVGHRFKWGKVVGKFAFPRLGEPFNEYAFRCSAMIDAPKEHPCFFYCFDCGVKCYLVSLDPVRRVLGPSEYRPHVSHIVSFSHLPSRVYYLADGSDYKKLIRNTLSGKRKKLPSDIGLVGAKTVQRISSFDCDGPLSSWEHVLSRVAYLYCFCSKRPHYQLFSWVPKPFANLLCVSKSLRALIYN